MKKVLAILSVGLVVVGGLCSNGFAQEFAADLELTADGQAQTSKAYVSKDRVRIEKGEEIILSKMGGKQGYVLFPTTKSYQTLTPEQSPRTSKALDGEAARESMGKETLSGQETEKFKVTIKTPDGTSHVVYQWVMADDVVIKMESEDKGWSLEYKNIHVGPLSEDLFTLPSDYRNMNEVSLPQTLNKASK